MDSPLKYPGSKATLMPVIETYLPADFENQQVFDLFCGGGGFFANIGCKHIIANDILKPLISFYKWLQRTPWTEVVNAIKAIRVDDKDDFEELKYRFNTQGGDAEFYVLAITCMSALIRFSNGWFNQTYGGMRFNPELMDKLNSFHQHITTTRITFSSMTYHDVRVPPDAFVYLDPPYLLMDAGYNESGAWGIAQEERLLRFLKSLSCPWMMSNVISFNGVTHPHAHEWTHAFRVVEVEKAYSKVGRHHSKGNHSQEVLIMNY